MGALISKLRVRRIPQDTVTKNASTRNEKNGIYVGQQSINPGESSHEDKARNSTFSNLSRLCRIWVVDLLACVVAFTALFAIIITLYSHNGRPLPDWPFGISVNALVSVFAVILKVTMLVVVTEGRLDFPVKHF